MIADKVMRILIANSTKGCSSRRFANIPETTKQEYHEGADFMHRQTSSMKVPQDNSRNQRRALRARSGRRSGQIMRPAGSKRHVFDDDRAEHHLQNATFGHVIQTRPDSLKASAPTRAEPIDTKRWEQCKAAVKDMQALQNNDFTDNYQSHCRVQKGPRGSSLLQPGS